MCLLASLHESDQRNELMRDFEERAGIMEFDGELFQAWGSSCEKQWAMEFPQYAVSASGSATG